VYTATLHAANGSRLALLHGYKELQLKHPLAGPATATVTLPGWLPALGELSDTVPRHLVVRRDGSPVFCGRVVSREYRSDGPSVTLVAADPLAELASIVLGLDDPVSWTDAARNTILRELIDECNAVRDTGLRAGVIDVMSPVSTGEHRAKKALELLQEMAGDYDGYDYRVSPREPTVDTTGVEWARLHASHTVGAVRPECRLPYGGGLGSVESFSLATEYDITTSAISLPPGFPSTSQGGVVTATDTAAVARWGTRQMVVPSDVIGDELRASLVAQAVASWAHPRVTVTAELAAPDPDLIPSQLRPYTGYLPGDVISLSLRACSPDLAETTGVTVYSVRVWEFTVTVGEDGAERVQLTLARGG